MAVWLHQLTARTAGEDILAGHGVRGGKAMIATLRWRLIAASIGAALEAAAGAAAAGGLSARRAVGLGQRCTAGLQWSAPREEPQLNCRQALAW
jgi:hypothetical protein